VVTQKGRNPQKTVVYKTQAQPLFASMPLVVLISGSSASASEIVAGALQDLDRAIIVGQRSYGKGLVQQTFSLPYNSLVKVTVAKYFTPSGRCIQAVDYAHRDENGGSGRFADSLIARFNTKAGRNVYNSNGIYPDVVTKSEKYSAIANSLITKNMFFEYANAYKKNNKAIAEASAFKLSDKDYITFISSLSGKDYSYSSKAERLLADLREEAENEKKLGEVKGDLESLKLKLVGAKDADLTKHKGQIKRLLESQIVARYYFEKGKILHGFQYDHELVAAKEILSNSTKILAILKGEGDYRSIGDPEKVNLNRD